jgi:hypothetical protein
MEALTAKLEQQALEIIKEVEERGGMTAAIQSGMPKRRIEECAARKQVGWRCISDTRIPHFVDEKSMDCLKVLALLDGSKRKGGFVLKCPKGSRRREGLTAICQSELSKGRIEERATREGGAITGCRFLWIFQVRDC